MSDNDSGTAPDAGSEVRQARARRLALGIRRPRPDLQPPSGSDAPEGQWALALSGGGIRSATVCLGVLQALAELPDPGSSPGPHAGSNETPAPTPTARKTHWPFLAQFDFLSTVSGGGFLGGFFTSLFVRGRLTGDEQETALITSQRAYEALLDEPPGRIHRDTPYDPKHPGRAALAWLRDNGRYMAPTGSSDVAYDLATAVRNWFAMQFVVASMIVLLLSFLQVLRWSLSEACLDYLDWEAALLTRGLHQGLHIWWSPSWALSGVVLCLICLPLGMAFWFSHPDRREQRARPMPPPLRHDKDCIWRDPLSAKPRCWTLASLSGLMLGLMASALGWWVRTHEMRPHLGAFGMATGVCTLLAVGWHVVSVWLAQRSAHGSIRWQRQRLTRWLSLSLWLLLSVSSLAIVETLGQTAWLKLSLANGVALSGVLTTLIWLFNKGAALAGERDKQSWLRLLPMDLLAGIVGVGLWLLLAAALDMALLSTIWPEGRADLHVLWNDATTHQASSYAWGALLVSALMAWVIGRFPGFLNLSTWQGLYSARLTRAYLGATNHKRFSEDASAEARDAGEPIAGDSISVDEAYANPLAPIHLVNVCINQSVSPGEQLTQRDRKGKLLVVAPGGVYFDQYSVPWQYDAGASELAYPLSYGEWLGVSGAAVSTGLGSKTEVGLSLAIGFANVRLGRWWAGLPQRAGMHDGLLRRLFPTQVYLLDELRGRFYGDHRRYQYLTDGGHFDNLGIYELLRPQPARQRQIRLIVACDNGCDPQYQFADLANLIRLVRIDHGLEIEVHDGAASAPMLNQVFASPDHFKQYGGDKPAEPDGRCAVMLNVCGTDRSAEHGIAPGALFARIILIKPVLLPDMSVDLAQYHNEHPSFPNESTVDQFFDEAQWESYRQLGLRLARRVFTGDETRGYADRFWQTALDGLPT